MTKSFKCKNKSISSINETSKFHDLLAKFLEITKSTPVPPVSNHTVMHHIVTKGPTIAQRLRCLSLEKFHIAKLEFDNMQGICRISSSCWASPLHIIGDRVKTTENIFREKFLTNIPVVIFRIFLIDWLVVKYSVN
ncbi:unnamed protein product [Psylliodes chrysocephalus]|uniref:Uncharacterized protein n=1 Tax=Psylliodes chrysocephalus TaxID=3402493 RepID=A0A9P0D0V2_9CUCU|nr:unnamed protein product [Psylliodes chrysocephala]